MTKKNILIATHSLGIGGCETYVVTLARELKEKGHSITIVASDGVFREYLESIGINVEIINFFERKYAFENIIKIEKIIEEKNITDVCINPFYPFFEVVIACVKQNINYDLFFHGVSLKGYFDIRNSFEMLGIWGNSYIKNFAMKYARNYVYASEEAKGFYEREYKLEENKGIVLKNSVKIEQQTEDTKQINKFAIFSRIDNDKIDSIKCAIQLYKKIYELNSNKEEMCLDIIGTGSEDLELQSFIEKDKKYNIRIKKETDAVLASMKNYDAIMGMGRVIIEAMSVKKIAILITYDNYIGIINANNDDNIEKISYANFSGRNMQINNIEQGAKDILELKETEIAEIINANYEYIASNNNIETNAVQYMSQINKNYILPEECKDEVNEWVKIIQYICDLEDTNKKITERIEHIVEENEQNIQSYIEQIKEQAKALDKKEVKDLINEKIEIEEQCRKKNQMLKSELEEKQKELEETTQEAVYYKEMLNNIYDKKLYKGYKFIKNIFKKDIVK